MRSAATTYKTLEMDWLLFVAFNLARYYLNRFLIFHVVFAIFRHTEIVRGIRLAKQLHKISKNNN